MNHAFAGKIPPAKLQAMCVHTGSKSSPPTWLMDSGATSHITNDIFAIQSPVPYNGQDKVYIGDGQGIHIHHTGNSVIHTHIATFRLNHVLHVPKMKFNLLSASHFLKDNHCKLTLDRDGSKIEDRSLGMTFFQGPISHGFYSFYGSISSFNFPSYFVSTKASFQLWHKRLGHPSSAILSKVLATNKIVCSDKQSSSFFCSDCVLGKNHKLPFNSSTSTISTSLALIHCDVWGPAHFSSISGYQFYVLFVDEYTKYNWLFRMKAKSEVYSIFVSFKSYVENIVGNKIKVLKSDSGGEFTSSMFNSFLLQHGIVHQYSCPHTPERNGCIERKHRHLT